MKREVFEQRAAELKQRMLNELKHRSGTSREPERSSSEFPVPQIGLEQHYRMKELVALTGFSRRTLRRLFYHEPGIVVLPQVKRRSVRKYASITVPESVVQRVLNRLRSLERNG